MSTALTYRERHADDWEDETTDDGDPSGNPLDKLLLVDARDFRIPWEMMEPIPGEIRGLLEQTDWAERPEGKTEAEATYSKMYQAAQTVGQLMVSEIYKATSEAARQEFHQELEEAGKGLDDWTRECGYSIVEAYLATDMRRQHINQYGYAVITEDAINWLQETTGNRETLEVGAGTGYLAYELKKAGMTVFATEPKPRDDGGNPYFSKDGPEWTYMEMYTGLEAVQRYNQADLLWSWPPTSDQAGAVLEEFTGKHFIHVGDRLCTGDDRFREILEEKFEEVGHHYLPNFPQLADKITVYLRKDFQENEEKLEYRTEEERIQEELSDKIILSDPRRFSLLSITGLEGLGEIHGEIRAELRRTNWEQREAGEGRDETEAETSFRRMKQCAQNVGRKYMLHAYATASDDARAELEERLTESGTDSADWMKRMGNKVVETSLAVDLRAEHNARFGFSTITTEAIDWIKEKIGDPPVVEVGAGTGYLAHEMNKRGMTVFPTEPRPSETGENQYFGKEQKVWTEIEKCDGLEAVRRYEEADLLWAWPPLEGDLAPVLEEFKGEHLIYIGDPTCTGTDRFGDILMEKFETVDRHPLPNFPDIRDQVWLLRRIH